MNEIKYLVFLKEVLNKKNVITNIKTIYNIDNILMKNERKKANVLPKRLF